MQNQMMICQQLQLKVMAYMSETGAMANTKLLKYILSLPLYTQLQASYCSYMH